MSKHFYTEEEAQIALREGQESGLDFYFMRYYSPLTYFACRLLEDQYLAEEITAEAFVKLWNKRKQLLQINSVKAWLYRTVRNASIDHLRKVKRLRVSEAGLQAPEVIEQSILHRMIESETIRQIIHTLDLLPPKCRQVFQLFYIDGKSYDEIATALGISPHTARNQKVRAVRLLKEKMLFLLLFLILIAW